MAVRCLRLRFLRYHSAHDIDERRELAGAGAITVDVVSDGDKANPKFAKEDFRIKIGLQVISAEPAHVLRQHQGYFPGLDFPG